MSLLPVPGKVFCGILLFRVTESVDKMLREGGAGFGDERSA